MLRSSMAGFTLIELLAVIIIIGAVLAVVLPRMPGVTGTYLKADVRRLSTLVRYLNEAAETKRVYYRMSLDMDRGTVRVDSSREGEGYAPVADTVIRGLRLAEGVRFEDMVAGKLGRVSSGTVAVVFTPTGSTEPFSLHIGSGGNGKEKSVFTLYFNPYSGRVTVTEGYI